MNELFQEKRNLFLLLAGLILVLLIVLYFVFIQPLQSDRKTSEANIVTLKEDIHALKTKQKRSKKASVQEDSLLFKDELPMTPDLDVLLRSLEEIETVSSSRISKIEFAYDANLPKPEEEETAKADVKVEASDGTEAKAEVKTNVTDDTDKPEEELPILKDVPAGLHTIAMRMEVASPDYQRFDQLMKAIEKLDRVTLVHTLEFEKPAEAALVLESFPNESITCQVELVTFYYDTDAKPADTSTAN